MIPLKPRTHPVNDVDVIPVYVIISSSIFRSPYSDGNPFVRDRDWETLEYHLHY